MIKELAQEGKKGVLLTTHYISCLLYTSLVNPDVGKQPVEKPVLECIR